MISLGSWSALKPDLNIKKCFNIRGGVLNWPNGYILHEEVKLYEYTMNPIHNWTSALNSTNTIPNQ